MTFTRRQLASELILQLDKGFDTERISKWADRMYYEKIGQYEDSVIDNILLDLAAMQLDPQFLIDEKQLKEIILKLLDF